MSIISDVIVSGISLVCGKDSPAVAHASAKFAIYKKRKGCSEEQTAQLEEIQKRSLYIVEKNSLSQ